MNRFLISLMIVALSLCASAQSSGGKFRTESLPRVLLNELNRFRISKGLDTLEMSEMLQSAAEISSQAMADNDSEKTDRKTALKFLKYVNATSKGEELVMKGVISKGREDFSTEDVAKVIYNRWENNLKDLPVVTNPKYSLVGIVGTIDEDGEKVYVSAFFGGYDIKNGGVIYKDQLEVPFNNKSKSLKPVEPKACKTCERWRNYDLLQKGLYVSDNKIYLRYPNAKDLRRFLKKEKDGLAVDIVQRSQFIAGDYNIVDNNLLNKGIMSKVLYKEALFKKNLLITKDKKANRKIKGIEVLLGKFDPKITGPYELNLLVIQNGVLCKTVTRGYNENATIESNTPIGLLPIQNSKGLKPAFEPRNESSIVNFIIPFEKNKAEFKQVDIEPFIKAMNEPDFIIDGLYIYAYASIEGDSLANSKLQRKRAESVVTVLQGMQNNKINPTIQTKDSWGLFLLENEDGKYADIVNLGKNKAIERINGDKKLLEELEPILAKERFAQIIMDVTYDVSGLKEEKFTTVSFNRAAKANNSKLAYKIMEFINRRVGEGKYAASIYDSLKIIDSPKNTGLLNNQIYYSYLANNSVTDEDDKTFDKLLISEPSNPILQYNKVFCQLKLDSSAGNAAHQSEVQQTINNLYGKLDSNYVNGLNIEWQFKIMETLDTLPNSEVQMDACIARIKQFYNIKDATWQNALKLASVFSRVKDYNYAATLLEPYLKAANVNENLVFMYISLASRVQEKYYSRTFAKAMEIAKNKNQERYCKLIGEPFMTFQVLENPEVKRVYNSSCGIK
ncbi:CAP domain-containing protein [Aurantibacillus circumpalustris]|uniref:CAP domain-containing protein n=1 Tax=Aurantibacillus circumpalustris TaxID=3036359 RepID=UPI00295AB82E|nr:CAP domain-containing protein [Aurantibacillus circumpalustris]